MGPTSKSGRFSRLPRGGTGGTRAMCDRALVHAGRDGGTLRRLGILRTSPVNSEAPGAGAGWAEEEEISQQPIQEAVSRTQKS